MRLTTLAGLDAIACVCCVAASVACCASGWVPAAFVGALLVGATMAYAAQGAVAGLAAVVARLRE